MLSLCDKNFLSFFMKKILLGVVVLLAMVSCKREKSESELAEERLGMIQQCYSEKLYSSALNHIDTLNTLYPKQVKYRKQAREIFLQIQIEEQERNRIFIDSLLVEKREDFNQNVSKFKFEKDEKYQTVGNYILKSQDYTMPNGGVMLKPFVEENGRFLIHSLYVGEYALKHISIRLKVGDMSIESEDVPVASGYNYTFNDGEYVNETVIYRSDRNKEIASFVEDHFQQTIKVTLNNGKRGYTYVLTPTEKNALIDAYALSVRLTDLRELERNLNIANNKLSVFQQELQTLKTE